MPAVVINARFLQRRVTGVERFGAEIVQLLQDRVRLAAPGRNLQGWRGHVWEQLALPSQLGTDEILWSMANSGPLTVRRQVLSLYDLSFFEHPEWYSRAFGLWYRLLLPRLVRRVQAVFTASNHVKIRIARQGWIGEERIKVIPGGVNPNRFYPAAHFERARVREKYALPEQYFISVGSIQPRKNLARLVQAFERLMESGASPDLALIGAASTHFRPAALDSRRGQIHRCGYAPDEDLPGLYSGALALVMPSLDEGFGLPVLEAMACGTPVIAARAGALPEAAGDAALLVDPFSVDEIARAMIEIAHDDELRKEYSRRGMERAGEFTWERCACLAWQALEALSVEGES